MYLNNVTLTGFIGGDADTRTTKNNRTFTTFSLATKNSWKDRESGEWTSRTEWHRAVVFGRLTAFAATLKKGDHVQIQGQLRTREYAKDTEKKTVTATVTVMANGANSSPTRPPTARPFPTAPPSPASRSRTRPVRASSPRTSTTSRSKTRRGLGRSC